MNIKEYHGKPFLVDVPVKINIWIRENCQRQQFEIIKLARPSIIFVQSDGGRNEKEQAIINTNRKMVESGIDWECKVFFIYENNNNGLLKMDSITRNVIWDNVEECIMLEDDQIPSVCFFAYCKTMLNKYKEDKRIECVCGMNTLEKSEEFAEDYFFSKQGSIWGYATWKSREENKTADFVNMSPKTFKMGLKQCDNKLSKRIFKKVYKNHNLLDDCGTEFWIQYAVYFENRVQIIPKYNLIKNIGFGNDAEHASSLKQLPKKIQKVFNIPTYEFFDSNNFIQNNIVIPYRTYEKKIISIFAWNNPIKKTLYKVESLFRSIIFGGFMSKVKRHFKRRK